MNVRAGSKSLFHMRGGVRYELTLCPPGLYSVSYPIRVSLRMCIYLACCSRRLKCRCCWMFWFPCQCLKCSEEMLMETTGHWGGKKEKSVWYPFRSVAVVIQYFLGFPHATFAERFILTHGSFPVQVWMLTWTCFCMLLSEMLSLHPAFPVDWSGLITHESMFNHWNSALVDREIWMMFF